VGFICGIELARAQKSYVGLYFSPLLFCSRSYTVLHCGVCAFAVLRICVHRPARKGHRVLSNLVGLVVVNKECDRSRPTGLQVALLVLRFLGAFVAEFAAAVALCAMVGVDRKEGDRAGYQRRKVARYLAFCTMGLCCSGAHNFTVCVSRGFYPASNELQGSVRRCLPSQGASFGAVWHTTASQHFALLVGDCRWTCPQCYNVFTAR
jgi:hypothetical protein